MIQDDMPALTNPVPLLDLGPEIDALWDELNDAFQRVLRSRQFIMGPEVEAFESEVAAFLGAKHAVGVNSGTDALVIGLRAMGIQPGDEVITTAFSFFATAESINNVGAKPVFVDVDGGSFNIDPDLIEAAITPATRAIMPVHLFGNPAAMDMILGLAREHGIRVIEDCAQSFGAWCGSKRTGTIGDVGAFSFFPSKNLGGFGDGGVLVTDDAEIAARAKALRVHGARRKYQSEMLGYNSRLDAIQAALLRVKLPYVDRWNADRRRAAVHYSELLSSVEALALPEIGESHVVHQYTVRILRAERDSVLTELRALGIQTAVYYPYPQHRLPVYATGNWSNPVSELLSREVLSLPIWPSMAPELQASVANALAQAVR